MKELQILLIEKGYGPLTIDGAIGPKSLAALEKYLKAEFSALGYKWFPKMLVGIRTDDRMSNTFDDFMVVVLQNQVMKVYPCSTTAGKHYIKNPITYGGITGTAVLLEGQYAAHNFVTSANWKSLWLGAPYFQQTRPVTIYRDGNRDEVLDRKITQKGLFGINIHRAGIGSFIDNWSAGCQTVPDKYWYEICKHFMNGEALNYTLIQS